jgi:hypothetical protein
MGRARNLARLIVDPTGDVDASALGNVPPSDDASALTTGTLPIERIADGAITTVKLGSGVVTADKIAAGAIPPSNDASALTVGTLPIARIADGAVTDAKLASGIDATKLTIGALARARLPAGSVLQVVQAFKTDSGTGGGTAFSDLSGLSLAITPTSASSKFLISFNVAMTMYDLTAQIRIVRNGTPVGLGDASSSRTQTTAGQMQPDGDANHQQSKLVGEYLDSPATTSAITYKLQFKTQDGTIAYFNRSGNDADNNNWSHRTTSSLTVMEIAG